MSLLDIKITVASLLNKTLADLTVNGQDLFLIAANQARSSAELAHDFEFNRQLLTLTVDGVTGGDLEDAVLYGTATTADIKTVVDLCQIDVDGNLRPIEWTTVSESLERQRAENPQFLIRYPSDGQIQAAPRGLPRLVVRNGNIYRFPLDAATSNNYNIGIEAYTMQADWTASNLGIETHRATGVGVLPDITGDYSMVGFSGIYPIYVQYGSDTRFYALAYNGARYIVIASSQGTWQQDTPSATSPDGTYSPVGGSGAVNTFTMATITVASSSDIWTTKGADYLQWQTIVILNHRFKTFVPRTEGNLPPPSALAQQALQELIEWDAAKFDANRRHGR